MELVDAPAGLGEQGCALWSAVTGKYQLRPDELRVLEAAAFEADLIATLQAGMVAGELTVTGSQGQPVINPLVSELRQHRMALSSLLRQLRLPDDNPEAAAAERSAQMRNVANARWSRRGG